MCVVLISLTRSHDKVVCPIVCAGRYSHARIGVKIVCDVDVRMSQRLACRVNTVRSIYQAAEFLAKRVKRFLLDNAL